MIKKVGILTQPLHDNYGGLLQAYALKTILEELGHTVEIINRRKDQSSLTYKTKELIKKIIGKGSEFVPTDEQRNIISQHTKYFALTYIKNITHPIYSTSGLKNISSHYKAFVIGSDQVWRPAYSPQISNYYLDFVSDSSTKGIAYAASFGVDKWEYSKEDTKLCKDNIHKLNAVSVREDSGVKLCNDYLGVDAVHVVDPTLLLDRKKYIELIMRENEPKIEGELMHYVLDSDDGIESLIQMVSDKFKYKVFTCHQKKNPSVENIIDINDFVYPKVTSWLNGFNSAEFVITDSFHGTIFSILFNKPFLVVANLKRGKARFDSLLKMFHLEDRLILDPDKVDLDRIMDMRPIPWKSVNKIIAEKREFALNFLKTNLG
ncbi:polysaccharide pyruvyl transferase family protein [Algoriphagus sp.]|uniref:polysaccharide pyruvyl transferase family protein n=1 Tax=Algoriphagus sp. TaxID=1872435 RepID=UPI003F729D63